MALHFLDWRERLETLQQIRMRLKARFFLVWRQQRQPLGHCLGRGCGLARIGIRTRGKCRRSRQPWLSLPFNSSVMRDNKYAARFSEAGFRQPSLFYAALSFRGWVMTA